MDFRGLVEQAQEALDAYSSAVHAILSNPVAVSNSGAYRANHINAVAKSVSLQFEALEASFANTELDLKYRDANNAAAFQDPDPWTLEEKRRIVNVRQSLESQYVAFSELPSPTFMYFQLSSSAASACTSSAFGARLDVQKLSTTPAHSMTKNSQYGSASALSPLANIQTLASQH
eukprot:ANDGO_05414.mRNA.1 hypothetical protein